MILSVTKKTSRLATMGELGQYPLWTKALALTLKYEWQLQNQTSNNRFTSAALIEMRDMASLWIDCWYTRVCKIKSLLNIPQYPIILNIRLLVVKFKKKFILTLTDSGWTVSIE